MRRYIIVSLLLEVLLCGCSEEKPLTVIDDLPPFDFYHLVAVDGVPEKRASHWIATIIPVAIVSPGVHMLSVMKKADFDVGPFPVVAPDISTVFIAKKTDFGTRSVTFTANLEAGKRYRIAATGSSVVVIEKNH